MAIMDLGTLGIKFLVDKTSWGKGFKEADADVAQHESKWKSFAGNMGGKIKTAVVGTVVGIGASVGAMAVSGVKDLIGLEDNMAKFKSATGMTAEETEKVTNTVKELFKTNEDSYEDITKTAEAMHNYMGMSADDIGKYAQNYMNYAKVTGQANDEVIKAIDDIGDAWGMNKDESVLAMDKMLVLQQDYGMSVQDSQSALTKMAPSLQAANMSFDEGAGYLAMFAQTGIDSATASTAFTKALQKVKNPEELQAMIKDIEDTEDSFEASAKASELFGSKAGVQMSKAIRDSDLDIKKFTESINKSGGAVTKASDNYDGSLKVKLALAKKQLQGLFQELAEKLMPIVNKSLDWITKHMPEIQAVLGAVFKFVGDIIGGTVKLIGKIIDKFSEFYTKNKTTIDKFTKVIEKMRDAIKLAMEKIGEIIGKVLDFIAKLWNKYGEKITNVVTALFEYLQTYIDGAMNVIKAIVDLVMAIFSGDWEKVWESIGNVITTVFTFIKDTIKAVLHLIVKIILNIGPILFDTACAIVTFLWDGLKFIVVKIAGWLKEIILAPVRIITGIGSALYDAGVSIFTSLWDGVKSIWKGISDWVGEKVKWIADKVMFWKSSDKEMDKGNVKADGSHYNGLNYVPYDGYMARLHKGERVLTAEENISLNNNQNNNNVPQKIETIINIDGKEFARATTPYISKQLAYSTR